MVKIAPSILACDLANLEKEVSDIEKAGAELVHIDVMDGMFVTNISFGLPVVEALRKKSNMAFDVHLMIEKPERYATRFIDAGADLLTFHIEACEDAESLLDTIRESGAMAAVSIKPATPIESVYPLLKKCDMVLIMTVEPGYGGQSFMPEMVEKITKLKAEIEGQGLDVMIQVDGGINAETAKICREAGADILVAGSSVFKSEDRKAAIDALR